MKIGCNGDASSSHIIGILEGNEAKAKEMCALRVTQARVSQLEQSHFISSERVLTIPGFLFFFFFFLLLCVCLASTVPLT
jgi:hypothetical protein